MADQPTSTTPSDRHAIVVGGSMAGLLAARVLADHFGQVMVLDRDRFPAEPVFRPGVPQGRHVHVLLLRGQAILDQLFPGLQDELAAAGAPTLDWMADCKLMNLAGWMPRFPSQHQAHTASRPLLEWTVRRRLAARSQVRFLEAREAVGLVPGAGGLGVAGVRVRPRDAEQHATGDEEELRADLVVDASGRDSHAADWLVALGYERPRETEVNSFLGYASRWYRRPASFAGDWKLLLISAIPPTNLRGGVIYSTEEERWLVTLAGANRDYPPTDDEGFLAFARSLSSPELYEALRDAEPLSAVAGYRRTENRLLHFEQLDRWPEGFVALGDAVCCFNPIYGQGMTTAALAATALDLQLRTQRQRHPDGALTGLGPRFQRALARVNALPWVMATGEDFRVPTTTGDRPGRLSRLLQRYFDAVILACPSSNQTYEAFLQVAHLATPPRALFYPQVAMVVAREAIKRRRLGAARAG